MAHGNGLIVFHCTMNGISIAQPHPQAHMIGLNGLFSVVCILLVNTSSCIVYYSMQLVYYSMQLVHYSMQLVYYSIQLVDNSMQLDYYSPFQICGVNRLIKVH